MQKSMFTAYLGVAVLATATLATVGGTPATADSATPLGLPAYGDHVVDDDHGHVFVSGGPTGNGVVVTNRYGGVVKTITGQYGATGLALDAPRDRLYVANAAGDAVSVIDLHSLTEIDRIPTGAQTCPTHLTRTDEVLWFGYGCEGTWNGGIGRIEFPEPEPPAEPQVTLNRQGSTAFQRAPLVTAHDDCAGPLVAGQPYLSLSTVYVYDVDDAHELDTRTSGTAPGSNLYDIALDQRGEILFTGAGSRNNAPAYSTEDLSGRGSYHSGYHPLAVAPTADDLHIAVGVRATGDDVYVYELGGVIPTERLDLTGDVLAPRGLAWSADGDTLYAVSEPPAGGSPTLHVVDVF
ncbi:YncE family protein [Micromonospora yangpuensis]|uniref:40-residue YVTN family beta-propeller repeat-containing protein n=1 Tax=Micromonospora yangpuensis TaxID=683228 RepID=A0A1C6V7F5_9ACTN|nr:hypothetical protein [Micromonospora yangpuensis]SCL62225.1 40-residue YVTN family beta-propeller repeat-containing protein [Micromonospora yangpuensis]